MGGTRHGGGRSPSPVGGLAALHFFLLFAGYSMLRPVRDALAMETGVDRLPWLFTATFVGMILIVPAVCRVARSRRGRLVLPAMELLFAGGLLAMRLSAAGGALSRPSAFVLMVGINVFNLLAVSLSWSVLGEFGGSATHHYGRIAAGASAGALAGPAAVALLAQRVGALDFLLPAAILLTLSAGASGAMARRRGRGALSPIESARSSVFVLPVAVAVVCSTAISTVLYFAQAQAVTASIAGVGGRTGFFAGVDLAANAGSLLLQMTATGPMLRLVGPGRTLAVASALVAVGLAIIVLSPGLVSVASVFVLHRVVQSALTRPARESLFSTGPAASRYQTKGLLDTALFRGTDAASAWAVGAARLHGLGIPGLASFAIPVAVLATAAGRRVWRCETAAWAVGIPGERKTA